MNIVSLAISIVAAIAAVVSVIIVYRQTAVFRQTNMLPILVDMFREFRSSEFKKHQYYIRTHLREECDPAKTGFGQLPEKASKHVLPVSHFFDNLGLLVAGGFIDEDLVVGFMGGSIEHTWSVLQPFISRERERRDGDYQEFFEHLVEVTRRNPPSHVRSSYLSPTT